VIASPNKYKCTLYLELAFQLSLDYYWDGQSQLKNDIKKKLDVRIIPCKLKKKETIYNFAP